MALKLQGIFLRREPKDIDIYFPQGAKLKSFIQPDGMKFNFNSADNDKYDNEYFYRNSYYIDGIQVDTFCHSNEEDGNLLVSDILPPKDLNCKFKMVHFCDIMKMKIMHAYGDHYTKYKHKDDIISFMANI